MVKTRFQEDTERFSCPICLELLNEPVAIPCGHSFCKLCISRCWEGSWNDVYRCPECREIFLRRPLLQKNIILAGLVEKLIKNRPDLSYAEAEDVGCDFCVGRKVKASKSCLTCLVSYCEEHLQMHNINPSKRHTLVDAKKKIKENFCFHPNKTMMFCRTDEQCFCFLCAAHEHEDHETVPVEEERSKKHRELQNSRSHIQKDLQLIEKQREKIISCVLEKNLAVLQEKLEQEIEQLKKSDAELQQLSTIEDPNQFLLSYLTESTHTPINLTELQSSLQEVMEDNTKVCGIVKTLQDSLLPEPRRRVEFFQYLQEITLDEITADSMLKLSKGNRKGKVLHEDYYHRPSPKLSKWEVVLSKQKLTERSYWEVELCGLVGVSVAYAGSSRSAQEYKYGFGFNDNSWMLRHYCHDSSYKYTFYHNSVTTNIQGPRSTRIGVYVDQRVGTLSFYIISNTRKMNLLHRVHTTFTRPLHMGIQIDSFSGGSVELIN